MSQIEFTKFEEVSRNPSIMAAVAYNYNKLNEERGTDTFTILSCSGIQYVGVGSSQVFNLHCVAVFEKFERFCTIVMDRLNEQKLQQKSIIEKEIEGHLDEILKEVYEVSDDDSYLFMLSQLLKKGK